MILLIVVLVLMVGFCIWMEFFSKGPGELVKLNPECFDNHENMLLSLCEMALFPFKQVTWRRCMVIAILVAIGMSACISTLRTASSVLTILIISFVAQYVAHNFMLFHGQVAKHLDYVPRLYHFLNDAIQTPKQCCPTKVLKDVC